MQAINHHIKSKCITRNIVVLLLAFPTLLNGQKYSASDSISIQEKLSATYDLESTDPAAAIAEYMRIYELSIETGYLVGAARGLLYSGIVYNDQGNYPLALRQYRLALPIAHESGFKRVIASVHNNMGVTFNLSGNADSCVSHYIAALKIFEETRDTLNMLSTGGNIGGVFMQMKQYDKGYDYYYRAYTLSSLIADTIRRADAANNLGFATIRLGNTNEAETLYREALKLATAIENTYLLYLVNNNLGDLYHQTGNMNKALVHSKEALTWAKVQNNPFHTVNALTNLGFRYGETGSKDSSVFYLHEATALARRIGARELLSDALLGLSDAYAKWGFNDKAFSALRQHVVLKDSLRQANLTRTVNELETLYRTEQKDREIAEQQLLIARAETQVSRQRSTVMILTGGLVILLLAGGLIYRDARQKAALEQEKFRRMEQESIAGKLKSKIEGQEEERKRLARELHDGIAGRMAIIRAKLKSGADTAQLAAELGQTDEEVRRIAHNLMPEILLRHGIAEALKTFVEQINGNPLSVELEIVGEANSLDQSISLNLYRIIQELVKNAIKHASASQLFVQVIFSEEDIHATVEDDGKGMKTDDSSGMGHLAIQERLDALEGSISYESVAGKGTAAHIEIPLKTRNK